MKLERHWNEFLCVWKGETSESLQALIFDSKYDSFKGVLAYVRVMNGMIKVGEKLNLMGTGKNCEVLETGIFSPNLIKKDVLNTGEVGYIATGLKNVSDCRVGDTLTNFFHGGKNILISGCLIYPSNSTCIPSLSWSNTATTVREEIMGEAWSKDWINYENKSQIKPWDSCILSFSLERFKSLRTFENILVFCRTSNVFWSFFGGELEIGETPWQALQRELFEELEWRPERGRFLYQWRNPDHPVCIHFFVVPFDGDRDQLVLHEGKDLRWFSIETIAQESKMAPHVLLHLHGSRETGPMSG